MSSEEYSKYNPQKVQKISKKREGDISQVGGKSETHLSELEIDIKEET
jgi:hypothetical protein